ncbi:MAG TPA: exo-alpha-sialidase [Bacteroidia bacterium]|jgi:hypothetical protein|nr:exo-alpha-sialidase [Bacteroidia bacterium]
MKTTVTYLSKKVLAILIFATSVPVITIAQWSAPVDLSPAAVSASTNESMGTCIGTGGDTVHVVWSDQTKKNKIAAIYYTRSADTGSSWSSPIALTSLTGNALNPAIAVNGRNIHVVWRVIDTTTGKRSSWYEHSLDGGKTWSKAIFIDSTSDWPAVSVSGSNVYIANDRHITASNSEIFFLRSTNNGVTWSSEQQLSFADGRSEDEAIHAEGSHIHMSWNDNRGGKFRIFYKESADYGVTWGPDVAVDSAYDYSTMAYSYGANVDVVAAGAPIGRYQIILVQSSDTGASWGKTIDLTNDTAHAYFYPDMVRDGLNLHITYGGNGGAWYLHSADGGTTWDPAHFFGSGGSAFVMYSGCVVHVIYNSANHVYYTHNVKGNSGPSCTGPLGINEAANNNHPVTIYPNPSNNSITVRSETELGIVTIYNLLGEQVYTEKTADSQKQIDISQLSAGIYILQANSIFTKIVKE